MANLENMNVITATDGERIQEQVQQPTNPIKTQDSSFSNRTLPGHTVMKFRDILLPLYLCWLIIYCLVIFLTIYGLLSDSEINHFEPTKWYPPLLSSTACAGVLGFTWQRIIVRNPNVAIRTVFWASPLLTCGMGIMFLYTESGVGLAAGVVALVSALIQSYYCSWVCPRFEYANRILSVSITDPPAGSKRLSISSILIGVLYCCFLVFGIGGARAIENETKFANISILKILLSLGWTMQFLKNVMQVTISRVKFMNLAGGAIMDTKLALHDTVKYLHGSVSVGSILVPFISVFRGFARSIGLVGGDTDEFMFPSVSRYTGISSVLVKRGNQWGFVHVGVYNKGFVQASSDVWDMFNKVGLIQLIDSDLTGSICFFSGVSGGAICSLVSGIWSIVLHKSYATELSIYAFLIGYFMVRLAIAWPEACVSAYYVAYATNPKSTQFDATIPVRLEQLQRSEAEKTF